MDYTLGCAEALGREPAGDLSVSQAFTGQGRDPLGERRVVGQLVDPGHRAGQRSVSLVAAGPSHGGPDALGGAVGDHAIVGVTLTGATAPVYVDPSYGNPAPLAQPYPTLAAYEPTAIAGFAVIYQQGSGGTLTPLPVEDIATTCATSTCVFDAVPYAPPPPFAAGRRIR